MIILGLVLQFIGLIIIAISMVIIKVPILIDHGPQGWIQYCGAMVGYLILLFGLFLDQWVKIAENEINIWRRGLICFLIGIGSYLFIIAYVLSSSSNQVVFICINLVGGGCLLLGIIIRFAPWAKKFIDNNKYSSYLLKGILILWVGLFLTIYLLYWGAPNEFWSFISRLGPIDIPRKLQDLLSHFFMYN